MDPERRKRLEARRRALQRDGARQARVDSVREQTKLLHGHGVDYELVFEDGPLVEWVWERFPLAGGLFSPRVDRLRVPVSEVGPGADAGETVVRAWLGGLLDRSRVRDEPVALVVGDGVRPGIGLTFGELAAHPALASDRPESWLVCVAAGWLIEWQTFHGGWWWGRAPRLSPPPRAGPESTCG